MKVEILSFLIHGWRRRTLGVAVYCSEEHLLNAEVGLDQVQAYARAQQDLVLMQKTLRTMSLNSVTPTRATAEIALRYEGKHVCNCQSFRF